MALRPTMPVPPRMGMAPPPAPRPRTPTTTAAGGWHAPTVNGVTTAPPAGVRSTAPAAQSATTSPTRGAHPFSMPGTGESWYAKNQGRFTRPRTMTGYWNGVQGAFSGGKVVPTNTRSAYGQVSGAMAAGPRGANNARDMSGRILNQDPYGEQAARQGVNYFSRPGAGETYAQGAIDSGYFQRPGATENYFSSVSDGLSTQGTGERHAYGLLGQFANPGAAEQNLGRAQASLGGINYGKDAIQYTAAGAKDASRTAKFADGYQSAMHYNPVENESRYFLPGLRDKSYSEKMYESGNGGLIDPFARAQEKQTKQIRDAAAARGMFNTGASMRLEEELGKDIAAEEAMARIGLAEQADNQRLGRSGAAQGWAGDINSAAMDRYGLGLSAATSADESSRANTGLGLDARKFASGEALEKVGMETDAASRAQQAQIDRLFKSGTLGLQADETGQSRMRLGIDGAQAADQAGINRYKTGYDIASAGQRLGMDRTNYGVDAGLRGQEAETNRYKDSAGIGLDADAGERDWLKSQMDFAGQTDDAEARAERDYIEKIMKGANLAKDVDSGEDTGLLNEANAAAGVQGLYEGRVGKEFDQQLRAAEAQAGITAKALGEMSDEQRDMALAELELQLRQAGMSKQQSDAIIENLFRGADIYLKAKGGAK